MHVMVHCTCDTCWCIHMWYMLVHSHVVHSHVVHVGIFAHLVHVGAFTCDACLLYSPLCCSFHVTNFSIEGFPFFLGIAIYCFEVKVGLPSWLITHVSFQRGRGSSCHWKLPLQRRSGAASESKQCTRHGWAGGRVHVHSTSPQSWAAILKGLSY